MLQPLDRHPSSHFAGRESDDERFVRVKKEIHKQLVTGLRIPAMSGVNDYELRQELRRGVEQLCQGRGELMNQEERERLADEIIDETLGLGPIDPLLHNPTITDILINGPRAIYVERRGRWSGRASRSMTINTFSRSCNASPAVWAPARRIEPDGRRSSRRRQPCQRGYPSPRARGGAGLDRRFSNRPLLAADLIARKSVTAEMIEFLAACIRARLNIVISGGTGSGKTTFLNMLSGYIPDDERTATIEDAAELQLQQPHVARMETRPANLEGKGEVTTRDLVRNALRMRPDRIVVGECRGSEAFDMLQAMTTGHDGSLTTIHSNNTRDAISRLEMLVGMAGFDLPIWFIHRHIASAVDIVVQCARLSGGARKVTQISEVTGVEGEVVNMHDLFVFEQTGVDETKMAQGMFRATGLRPRCLDRLNSSGQSLSMSLFERRILEPSRLDGIAQASMRL